MRSEEEIVSLVEKQIDSITSAEMKAQLRRYLVAPALHYRDWEYSQDPTKFPCWTVAILISGRLAIAYSDHGHGVPWGLVDLENSWFGMDSQWFLRLEDAFIQSGMWKGTLPTGYEVA
jgi:hypothetical protein